MRLLKQPECASRLVGLSSFSEPINRQPIFVADLPRLEQPGADIVPRDQGKTQEPIGFCARDESSARFAPFPSSLPLETLP